MGGSLASGVAGWSFGVAFMAHPGFVSGVERTGNGKGKYNDKSKYGGLSATAAKAPPSVEMTVPWVVRKRTGSGKGKGGWFLPAAF